MEYLYVLSFMTGINILTSTSEKIMIYVVDSLRRNPIGDRAIAVFSRENLVPE